MEVTSALMNELLETMDMVVQRIEVGVHIDAMLARRIKEAEARAAEQDERIEELENRLRDLEAGSWGEPPEDPEALVQGEDITSHLYTDEGWEEQ